MKQYNYEKLENNKRILIDGRFIGVGDSQTRYVLELVKGILSYDKTNQYTLLIRPVGKNSVEQFFKSEIRISKSEITASGGIPSGCGTNSNDQKNNFQNVSSFELRASSFQNLRIKFLDIPHYSIAEQTKLLKYLNDEKFDLVHFTQFNHPVRYNGKYVVTIQDLTLVGHLHRQNLIKRVAFGKVMRSAARDSAKIIAISKTAMDEVIEYYGVPKEKFAVIYHGMDHSRFSAEIRNSKLEIRNFKEKYQIDSDYILYTGMWKRHKNLLRMLKAFEVVKSEIRNPKSETNSKYQIPNIQLVLIGKVDRKEPEILTEINRINNLITASGGIPSERGTMKQYSNEAIVLTGFISEEDLPIAYAGAFAYVIPSLSEGFGWPPLEAMACGTPVIASKESSIPEICGNAPLYFDAYNIDDIAQKMKLVASDRELRKDLIKKGLEQVKKYDWFETAEKTLAVYKELLG